MVESTSDVDETMVCTTLQQLRANGDINALFQIKVQVKNWKVYALLSNLGASDNLEAKSLGQTRHYGAPLEKTSLQQ